MRAIVEKRHFSPMRVVPRGNDGGERRKREKTLIGAVERQGLVDGRQPDRSRARTVSQECHARV